MNLFTKGRGLFNAVKAQSYLLGNVALTATFTTINQITSAFGSVSFERGVKVGVKAIGGAALHAGVLAWQNPEASAVVITRIVFDVTTKSTAASTTDIGTTATSATTSSDTLIDGLDTSTAAITADNLDNHGTNGKSLQKLASGKWVTFTEASGNVTGMVANAYIHYVVV